MHQNAFVCKFLPYIILLKDPYLKCLSSSYCLRHLDSPRTKYYCNFVPKSKHPVPGEDDDHAYLYYRIIYPITNSVILHLYLELRMFVWTCLECYFAGS